MPLLDIGSQCQWCISYDVIEMSNNELPCDTVAADDTFTYTIYIINTIVFKINYNIDWDNIDLFRRNLVTQIHDLYTKYTHN